MMTYYYAKVTVQLYVESRMTEFNEMPFSRSERERWGHFILMQLTGATGFKQDEGRFIVHFHTHCDDTKMVETVSLK